MKTISQLLFSLILLLCPLPVSADALQFLSFHFMPFTGNGPDGENGTMTKAVLNACLKLKHDCNIKYVSWPEAQQIARQQSGIIGIFPIAHNSERERWLKFSQPIAISGYGFFVNEKKSFEVNNLSDFKGFTIGTFGPSNTHATLMQAIDNISDVNIIVESDFIHSIKMMSAGRYGDRSSLFGNIDVVEYIKRTTNYASPLKLVHKYSSYKIRVGFPIKFPNSDIVREFDRVLTEQTASDMPSIISD